MEGHYIIFTGKYDYINFKMKITYYPTLPCDYNIARFPTLNKMEGPVWKTIITVATSRLTEDDILT